MDLAARALVDLNPGLFGLADPSPIESFQYQVPDGAPSAQRVLRMCLKAPGTSLRIPNELSWLDSAVGLAFEDHAARGLPRHGFVYATIRRGVVVDSTDDEWHVDGFSMRMPHAPEQNYIFADAIGTQWLDQSMQLPEGFDGMRHNIHSWFQAKAKDSAIRTMDPGRFHLIDPYVVHRRPALSFGTRRTFIRISFVPIEIEDGRNTANPLLPRPRFDRPDIRGVLAKHGQQDWPA